ncbi:CinA family protein [Aquabacterium sp.]|uniref:CinA family protein n=1 Tax=Aquabacterium sp. TaxID=1872578 RepID=UPI003D6D68AD
MPAFEEKDPLPTLVRSLAERLTARGWQLATAESCTGGLIAAACTELSGSSAWFERGFITYSNEAKTDLLGVDAALIAAHGAVSEPVARAMAEGALARSRAQVAVAVTGVAGPTGGSPDKPVGTVWLAWAVQGQATRAERCLFPGDRAAVRQATVLRALQGLLS